jgi:sugar phosphate isomerase/epimerase
MVPGNSLTEKALKLKKWDYDGIAIFLDFDKWNDEIKDEIYNLYNNTGIKPCEFVFISPSYGHLMDKDQEIKRKAIDLYKEAIKVCKKIGAITEMEYQYKVQDPLPLFNPYQKIPEQEEREFLRIINELGQEVEDSNAYILLEPCNRYETKYLTTLKDCKEIIKKTNLSNIGILADFFHMSIEEADIPNSIINAGAFIKHIHLGDNNRLLPGYGHTDWESAFHALKKIGFGGYMNLECGIPGNVEEELPKTAKYLKDIINSMD